MASKRGSKKEPEPHAKVHRFTSRHHVEVMMTAYARRLDKIYTEIDMAHMVPQVVQKMHTEYKDNPHDLYLLVCKKYGVDAEEEFDVDLLVYGRTKSQKFKLEQDGDKERVCESKESETVTKVEEVVEKPVEVVEVKKEESQLPVKRISPRYSPRQSPRQVLTNTTYQRQASPRRVVDARASPRMSPRMSPREKIEYVILHPGDFCETMVLTSATKNQETGFWIPARVIVIDMEKETMNLEVVQQKKYHLPKMAMNVPYRYVRKPAQISWQY